MHVPLVCRPAQSQSHSSLDRHQGYSIELNDCVFTSAVLCPHVPGTSWSIFPIPLGNRSEAALWLCSHGVRVRVLSWRSVGERCRGKAGCTSLLPENFGFTPPSRPARPSGKWHSICMSEICLRRGERLGIDPARNYDQNCEPTGIQF